MAQKEKKWLKEFDKVLNDYNCVIEASEEVYQDGRKVVKQFIKQLLTQQRTELLEEIKTRIDTWGGFEDGGGNPCHYDSEILEWIKNLLNKKDE